MVRMILSLLLILVTVFAVPTWAVDIPERDVETFSSPCTLVISQSGSVRTLTWDTVSGAVTYKVGYRIGTAVTGLAELTGTSYEHVGWTSGDCLEYVLVAYDAGGAKVCAAHVENVGTGCPQ